MSESYFQEAVTPPEIPEDITLRPPGFEDFHGQEKVTERLMLMVAAAKGRDDVLEHVLLSGPPGLGKTTLANIVATAVGTTLQSNVAEIREKIAQAKMNQDLRGETTILFIDEIHRFNPAIEEYLYPAMEDYRLDIIIDSGPSARSIQIQLPKFTLVGATTRSGMLTSPLRSRFGLINRLDYYTHEQLAFIIERSAAILSLDIKPGGASTIASRSRGTPRIANNALLRWVRDYAQVRGAGIIDQENSAAALAMIEIDSDGLDEMDKRLLEVMIYKFGGGPVGLNTLAVACGEDAATLEEVHEPFLIMQGFVQRTPRGRVAMPAAYVKIGAPPPALKPEDSQAKLF